MTCTPGLKITPAKIASGVIVHELSHALAGTVDIQFGEGVSVYGVENCKKLAKENPQLAIQNADNCEYWLEVPVF